MNTVTVEIVVYEGTVEVARRSIRYFEGQDYTVAIDTPAGRDVSVPLKAGGGDEA